MSAELKKVMLVEDDRDVRTVAKTALEMVGGFTVCACESGTRALAAVAEFGPQLVLLDVMMPEMDGPALLVKLRERPETAKTPVVFLTAKARTDDLRELTRQGALGVIVKPFDPMTLSDEVKRLWSRAD